MTEIDSNWAQTNSILRELEPKLKCKQCGQLKEALCIVQNCEHFFCRSCINNLQCEACPVCSVPFHVKDIHRSTQLNNAVKFCKQLNELLLQSSQRLSTVAGVLQETGSVYSSGAPCSTTPEQTYTGTNYEVANCSPVRNENGTAYWHFTESEEIVGIMDKKELSYAAHGKIRSSNCYKSAPMSSSPSVAMRTRNATALLKKREKISNFNKAWGIVSTSNFQSPPSVPLLLKDSNQTDDQCNSCRKKPQEAKKVLFTVRGDACSVQDDTPTCKKISAVIVKQSHRAKLSMFEETTNCNISQTCWSSFKNDPVKENQNSKLGSSRQHECRQESQHDSEDNEGNNLWKKKSVTVYQSDKKKRESSVLKLPCNNTSLINEKENVDTKMMKSEKPTCETENKSLIPGAVTVMKGKTTKTENVHLKGVETPVRPKFQTSSSTSGISPKLIKRNAKGETALHVAVIKGDWNKVTSLLNEGANPNVRDNAGWTPLHEACNHGYTQIAELLIQHGAMVNTPGMDHDTPLHDAIQNQHIGCIRLLVSHGASTDIRNIYGWRPVDYVKTEDILDVIQSESGSASHLNESVTSELMKMDCINPVFLATGLTREQKIELQKCAKILHGRVVSDFFPEVTHVITAVNSQGMCPRTLKYLHSVLTGKWILNFEWVKHCLQYKGHICEEAFEVPGSSSNPNSQAAKKGRINNTQQLPGLLSGCNIYFQNKMTYPTPPKEELVQLVKNGGGNVFMREPKLDLKDATKMTVPYHVKAGSDLAQCQVFYIYDHDNQVTSHLTKYHHSAPVSWLMDCIANFELKPYKVTHTEKVI